LLQAVGLFLFLISLMIEYSYHRDYFMFYPGEYMKRLRIKVASFEFIAQMEDERAPQTCAEFRGLLPYTQKLIHARWSGEACWIPLGDFKLEVGFENATSYPALGDILFYPGGYSETEILFPYGATCFASKLGQLAGNHFLTIIDGREHLQDLGRLVLWHGAQDIVFEAE
jgi:hypothetical protein